MTWFPPCTTRHTEVRCDGTCRLLVLTSRLKRLADLKTAGVVSDAEFEAATAKLLGI